VPSKSKIIRSIFTILYHTSLSIILQFQNDNPFLRLYWGRKRRKDHDKNQALTTFELDLATGKVNVNWKGYTTRKQNRLL
jgi:hypothetical protein